MHRFKPLTLAFLTACSITAPPRDLGQWTTTTHDVTATWRLTVPGTLAVQASGAQAGADFYADLLSKPVVGRATWVYGGSAGVIDIDVVNSRRELARVAAHEYAHIAQARFLLAGISRPDLGPYFVDDREGFAETYAREYVRQCGDSLRPLGWVDFAVPMCAEAPDPKTVTP